MVKCLSACRPSINAPRTVRYGAHFQVDPRSHVRARRSPRVAAAESVADNFVAQRTQALSYALKQGLGSVDELNLG